MVLKRDPPLPVVRVGDIPSQDHPQRWLVEQLWGASSVGVIGGAPKCSKTWLGLDLALSVATGTACLGLALSGSGRHWMLIEHRSSSVPHMWTRWNSTSP